MVTEEVEIKPIWSTGLAKKTPEKVIRAQMSVQMAYPCTSHFNCNSEKYRTDYLPCLSSQNRIAGTLD